MSGGVDRRAQIDAEIAKALVLINGGGAIALLSLFNTVFAKPGTEPFVSAILVGDVIMMIGLTVAVVHNYLRRKCSLHFELHGMRPPSGVVAGIALPEPTVCFACTVCLGLSLLSFIGAGAYVAWSAIESVEPRTAVAPHYK